MWIDSKKKSNMNKIFIFVLLFCLIIPGLFFVQPFETCSNLPLDDTPTRTVERTETTKMTETTDTTETVESLENTEFCSDEPSTNLIKTVTVQPRLDQTTRAPLSYVGVTAQGMFQDVYLGDRNNNIFFTVTETYDGDYFTNATSDTIPEGDEQNASLWNLTIESMEVYFNGQLNSPIEWVPGYGKPDNNNGQGFLVEDTVDIYNDSLLFQDLRFNVLAENIQTGLYELRLTFRYHILSNYSAPTNRYNWTIIDGDEWISEVVSLSFEVRSCLSSSLQCFAVDEDENMINNGRFFAGAQNQKIGIYFDEDYPHQSLNNVSVTMSPPNFIELYNGTSMETVNTVSINSISSMTPFYWRINMNNNITPGIYLGSQEEGYVTYEYVRGDNLVKVTEIDKYPITFTVDYTPLVIPPYTDSMKGDTLPEHQIVQGTAKTELIVNFSNAGNIELYDIEVGLDLSNSFIQAPYYYDAGNNDLKTEIVLSDRSINKLAINAHDFAKFNLSIFKNLPKGKYLIPVVYTGWYYNNGTLGDSSGWVKTTQNDFIQIRSTRNLQMLDTQPHVAIEILNPQPHITLNPTYISTFTAGQHNQVIDLTISNYELYSFQNVTISVITNQDSPFEYIMLNKSLQTLTNKTFNFLPAGTVDSPYQSWFSILGNVKPDATGFYSVPVIITGLDEFNDPFEIMTHFDVSIYPQLPEFIIIKSENSKVIPGEELELKITLKNIGYSDAHDLEVLFISSSGFFHATGSQTLNNTSYIGDLGANQIVTITLDITADTNITLGESYMGNLRFKYRDDLGTLHGFNDNPQALVYIHTVLTIPPPASNIIVVTNVQSKDVKAGSTVTLSITVMNIGSLDMIDSDALLISNSNLFLITPMITSEPDKGIIGALASNEQKTIDFELKIANSVAAGEEYSFRLLIEYEDSAGQVVEYNVSDWHDITLRVKETEPKEDDRINWELVTVGILGVVAAIIFVLLLGVVLKRAARDSKKQKDMKIEKEKELTEDVIGSPDETEETKETKSKIERAEPVKPDDERIDDKDMKGTDSGPGLEEEGPASEQDEGVLDDEEELDEASKTKTGSVVKDIPAKAPPALKHATPISPSSQRATVKPVTIARVKSTGAAKAKTKEEHNDNELDQKTASDDKESSGKGNND